MYKKFFQFGGRADRGKYKNPISPQFLLILIFDDHKAKLHSQNDRASSRTDQNVQKPFLAISYTLNDPLSPVRARASQFSDRAKNVLVLQSRELLF